VNSFIKNPVDLDTIKLQSGGHDNWEEGACLLETASYLAGEPWTDHPKCVSLVITRYGIALNDRLGDEDRQKLKPFIPGMLGTADDGLDDLREFMLADWSIRVATPRWLDLAGLTDEATRLRETAPVVDAKTLGQALDAARAVRANTYELRTKRRAELKAIFVDELKKNPDTDLVAVAAAAAVAVAAAAAVAVAAADAAADAVAVAVAVAAADADARYTSRWYEVYNAVKAKLLPIYREGLKGSKYAEVREQNLTEGIALLGQILKPTHPTD
jgi:hypothetical protein